MNTEAPARADIERMCGYVTDDGAVAAYFRISREQVQSIRATRYVPEPKRYIADRKDRYAKDPVNLAKDVDRRANDAQASQDLCTAILRMFTRFERKHGLKEGEGAILMLDTGLAR